MMHSTATYTNLGDKIGVNNPTNNININNNSNNVVDFSVGSIPANYGYDETFSKEEDPNESQFKPRILIMGLRR